MDQSCLLQMRKRALARVRALEKEGVFSMVPQSTPCGFSLPHLQSPGDSSVEEDARRVTEMSRLGPFYPHACYFSSLTDLTYLQAACLSTQGPAQPVTPWPCLTGRTRSQHIQGSDLSLPTAYLT